MSIYYPGIRKGVPVTNRPFVTGRLLDLRAALTDQLPQKTLDKTLVVGSWNLRDFGSHKFNPEPRLPESYYYIAEILDRFDVCALQEINDDLEAFNTLMRIMGRHYDYIATDTTEGTGGNGERMVFLYDKRKVEFRHIAGEVVLPPGKETTQFRRTPFVVSFQCGWLKFDLCTAHLYYGDDTGPKKLERIREINDLAKFMVKRAKKNGVNTFILGDFNVESDDGDTWKAIEKNGFVMPEAVKVHTDLGQEHFYDRIAFHSAKDEVKLTDSQPGGTFKMYDHVFRDEDIDYYKSIAKVLSPTASPQDFKTWKTWQVSDHQPLWVHLKTDFADGYLTQMGTPPSP